LSDYPTPGPPDGHTPPGLEFAFEGSFDVSRPLDIADRPYGKRRIIPITGGTFEGPRVRGEVVPGGADWQIVHSDALVTLTATYALRADDGALIAVTNSGFRRADPELLAALERGEDVDQRQIYFRTTARFETDAPQHRWLSDHLFIGSGRRRPGGVIITFWQVG